MTKVTIFFLIGVGVYLVGLGVFTLVKYLRYKKQLKKDEQAYEEQETKDTDSVD